MEFGGLLFAARHPDLLVIPAVGRDPVTVSFDFRGDANGPLMQRAFRTPAGARVTFSLLAQRESNQREIASEPRLATRLEGAVGGCGNLINLGLHETSVRLRNGFFNVPWPRGLSVTEASFCSSFLPASRLHAQ